MATRTDGITAGSDEDYFSELCGNINNNTLNINYSDLLTEEIAYTLNVYLTPVLVIMGIIGNLLSVIVFFKVKLQGQSTSQYLSALAISDTVFLLQLIPPWLKAVKASLVFARNGFCQVFAYSTYVSSSLSSWLVVAFTVERFVAVLYPLRRTRLCTLRRARLLILLITVCCLAMNVPVLVFAVPTDNDCNIDDDLMDHAARFNVVDTVYAFSLPLAVITVLNVWITVQVCRQGRARGRLLSQEAKRQGERAGGSRRVRGRRARLVRRSRPVWNIQQRITRTLLIVSSVFVVLNLPAYSMRIMAYANNMSSHEYTGRWAAIQQICLQFFNVNFGINFFLYCLTGQNFRRALCQTFPCLSRAWKTMNRLCCWRTEEQKSPTGTAAARSRSTHTEATKAAMCEESPKVNMHRETSWPGRSAGGLLGDNVNDDYFEMYCFNTFLQRTRHTRSRYPVNIYKFKSGYVHRPVARAPGGLAYRPATPANTRRRSTTFARSTFQPIPYDLVPGQIAPFTTNPALLTPNPEPSPTPDIVLPWQGGCCGFGPVLAIRPDDRLRVCPCKYENFNFDNEDTQTSREGLPTMPKKRVSFMPVHGPARPSAAGRVRARSQSQPVYTRSLCQQSPEVSTLRRCTSAPATFSQRASDATSFQERQTERLLVNLRIRSDSPIDGT